MKICYETVRNSEEIRTYITRPTSPTGPGFTEHSFAHVTRCAEFAARILAQLGYGEHDQSWPASPACFARRAFNINSLSVSPTERPDISRRHGDRRRRRPCRLRADHQAAQQAAAPC